MFTVRFFDILTGRVRSLLRTAAKFAIEPIGTFLVYHTVFQIIQFTLTGAALGWIYRNNDKKER